MKITKTLIKNLIIEKDGIAKLILQDILDEADYSNQTQKEFQEAFISSFNNLLNYGTNNGSIRRLICYTDTHAFFDEHYDEIEDLREEYEENVGEPLHIKGDLKDFMAKFGYEETAKKLASELEIEC